MNDIRFRNFSGMKIKVSLLKKRDAKGQKEGRNPGSVFHW